MTKKTVYTCNLCGMFSEEPSGFVGLSRETTDTQDAYVREPVEGAFIHVCNICHQNLDALYNKSEYTPITPHHVVGGACRTEMARGVLSLVSFANRKYASVVFKDGYDEVEVEVELDVEEAKHMIRVLMGWVNSTKEVS